MIYDLLFVYGTLRMGSGHRMAERLRAQSLYLGPASARGRLFSLGAYPGFAPGRAGVTKGDLVRLHDPAVTLAWIDDYEECGAAHPPPHEYRRARLSVAGPDAVVEAWVYALPTEGLTLIPGGDFLACAPPGAG